MIRKQRATKKALAKQLGISRASLYYVSKQFPKDWALKIRIEEVLSKNPGYGSPRVADELGINEKRAARVMRLFGIQAYRRRGRKYKKNKAKIRFYPNLLKEIVPKYPHHAWASDFTEMKWRKTKLYLATIIDIFTREIVGWSLMKHKGSILVMQAMFSALSKHPRPVIYHSDNGKEYDSKAFRGILEDLDIAISRSKPAAPWENGYQEGFYSQFEVDFGDPDRFDSLGELVAEVYRHIAYYNNQRIHTALKTPPRLFAQRFQQFQKVMEKVS